MNEIIMPPGSQYSERNHRRAKAESREGPDWAGIAVWMGLWAFVAWAFVHYAWRWVR